MVKFVTVAEMRAIEQAADASGLTYAEMMEHAGHNLAEVVNGEYAHLDPKTILGLVGKGNNGGDTLVALTWLASQGWTATAYLVSARAEGDPLVGTLAEAGGQLISADEDQHSRKLAAALESNLVVLDGILGTGIKLPVKGPPARVLKAVKKHLAISDPRPTIVAVDCPSGVDCDTGEAAPETLRADLTVTMAAIKRGLLAFPAYQHVGALRIAGIGLPADLPPWEAIRRVVVDEDFVRVRLPERPLDAHKGSFGTAMIIAGSTNYTGAALLAGKAAYRAGAGLVTLAVPTILHAALAGQFPEATWLLLPHEIGVIARNAAKLVRENLGRVTALCLGPGFGLEDTTKDFIERLLGVNPRDFARQIGFVGQRLQGNSAPEAHDLPPCIADADGLKLLASIPGWQDALPKPAILTPHPGEMAVLTGLSKDEIQSDRLGVAEKFAQEWGHVVVLKGAFTIVATPDGRTALVPVATPALARAGTGDVLAGVIAGLLAQGLAAFEAAAAGAWLHAQAGLFAEARLGTSASVIAGDVLDALPEVLGKVSRN